MAHIFFAGVDKPVSKPEDVIPFLGRGERHWKVGRSAYELAYSWMSAQGVPKDVRAILDTDDATAKAELRRATFEKKTDLDKTGRGPSQTDLLAQLMTTSGSTILGVEGKVDETFGPLVSEWIEYSPGKLRRLAGLIELLRLNSAAVTALRYQLLHRTAAVLIEANEQSARHAIMLVQSFSPSHIRAGFNDFQNFSNALGTPVSEPGRLSAPGMFGDVQLRLGWCESLLHTAGTA